MNDYERGFEDGLTAVRSIRCLDHMDMPQMNQSANGTAECGACIAADLTEAKRLLRDVPAGAVAMN